MLSPDFCLNSQSYILQEQSFGHLFEVSDRKYKTHKSYPLQFVWAPQNDTSPVLRNIINNLLILFDKERVPKCRCIKKPMLI